MILKIVSEGLEESVLFLMSFIKLILIYYPFKTEDLNLSAVNHLSFSRLTIFFFLFVTVPSK